MGCHRRDRQVRRFRVGLMEALLEACPRLVVLTAARCCPLRPVRVQTLVAALVVGQKYPLHRKGHHLHLVALDQIRVAALQVGQ